MVEGKLRSGERSGFLEPPSTTNTVSKHRSQAAVFAQGDASREVTLNWEGGMIKRQDAGCCAFLVLEAGLQQSMPCSYKSPTSHDRTTDDATTRGLFASCEVISRGHACTYCIGARPACLRRMTASAGSSVYLCEPACNEFKNKESSPTVKTNRRSRREDRFQIPDVCLARAQSQFNPKLPALQNKEQQACNAGSRYKRRSPPVRLSTSAATAHPPAVSEDVFALHDGCTFGHDGKHGWPERSRSPEAVAGLGRWRCM